MDGEKTCPPVFECRPHSLLHTVNDDAPYMWTVEYVWSVTGGTIRKDYFAYYSESAFEAARSSVADYAKERNGTISERKPDGQAKTTDSLP